IALAQAPPLSLEKEMERIEGKRARNVARTARYLDARLRTIGLDTDALDQQMREQRAREERERMALKEELDRNDNVYKHVAIQEADERRLRDEELERMRLQWIEQMQFKQEKEQREKEMLHAGVDFDKCGPSAVQRMSGEDPDKLSRTAQQRAQMRAWSMQLASERIARKEVEENEMADYWAYLEKVNQKQGKLTEDEEAARKALNLRIKDENRRRALERAEEDARQKELDAQADAEELRFRDQFLREDEGEDGSLNAGFKGLSRKQKAELLQSNADMRAARLREAELAREEEAAWYLQQEKMRVAMELADQEERQRVKDLDAERLRALREQQLDLQQRNMRERNSRFGDIDYTHGIYAGFGKSCR
ncbi:unnamed protein product, partial [Scytosiphon promiscuus]